jgi:hypothetical protein
MASVHQMCQIRLPNREAGQTVHRLSFRLAYPPQRLGFVGVAELALPELFQTFGMLEWVLTLPAGFDAQIISSGLETRKSPSDLRVRQEISYTFAARDFSLRLGASDEHTPRGSVRSEPRRLSGKELPPAGLR